MSILDDDGDGDDGDDDDRDDDDDDDEDDDDDDDDDGDDDDDDASGSLAPLQTALKAVNASGPWIELSRRTLVWHWGPCCEIETAVGKTGVI